MPTEQETIQQTISETGWANIGTVHFDCFALAHVWVRKRVGGDPTEAGSTEVVEYCENCGAENLEED